MTNSTLPRDASPGLFSAASFAALALARLRPATAGTIAPSPSDYDLNPGMSPSPDAALKPAAVLIGIVARAPLTVILTQRTETLPHHAGQIAFPGGKIEPDDVSPQAAALREAYEETGLDPALVTPLGFLDTYRTGTGFRIEPLVALVDPRHTLTPDPGEVADVFEVPLAFLMDPRNYETHSRLWQGAERRFHAISFDNRYIWGATAGILKNMHERLFLP